MAKLPAMCASAEASNSALDVMHVISRSMMAEFNRKKKAYEVQKTKFKQSGSVDTSRLARYKVSDNIFKRNKQLPEGKSHGVYVLVDTSSSMDRVYPSVLMQASQIAIFCKTCNIPFKIVTFTSGFSDPNDGISVDTGIRSFELFSSNMTMDRIENLFHLIRLTYGIGWNYRTSEQNSALSKFFGVPHFQDHLVNKLKHSLNTSGTPLYKALIETFTDCNNFRIAGRIQNMNFLTISDGADTSGLSACTHLVHPISGVRVSRTAQAELKMINALFGLDKIKHHVLYIASNMRMAANSAPYFGCKRMGENEFENKSFLSLDNTYDFSSVALVTAASLIEKDSTDLLAKHIVKKFTDDYGF